MAQKPPFPTAEDSNLFDSLLGSYYMSIRIGPYERPEPFRRAGFTYNKTILLPLPQDLRDDTSVRYSEAELATVGDIINGDLQGAAGGIALRQSGAALNGLATRAGEAADKLANTSFIANLVNETIPADQITSAIQQSLGVAPNPNPSVQFTGPNLREFAWTWTLFPANEKESRKIKKVVDILKAASLPRNAITDQGSILRYPDMCQLNFYPWDKPYAGYQWGWGENSIIKIKRCMISSVNVMYTPSNTPAFHHSTQLPVVTQLTISFKEIEYLLSEDWGGEAGKGNLVDIFFGDNVDSLKNTFSSESLGDIATEAASHAFDVAPRETAAAIESEEKGGGRGG